MAATDIQTGAAGSITMILLFTTVALLLRSFYKRYTRLRDRGEND